MPRCPALLVAAVLLPAAAAAQSPNPVHLFVAELTPEGHLVRLGSPRKLTGDRGTNSQPSFTPDGRAILFSAIRDTTGRSDIYRIELATGEERRITSTPENENSPTVTLEGDLAAVRWVPATLFREWGLWRYTPEGLPGSGVLPAPDTVGYYAQVDRNTWALMRPAARFAVAWFDVAAGTTTDIEWPVATLPPQRIPGARAVSFTRTDSLGRNELRRLDAGSRQATSLGPTLVGRTVHAWAGPDLVLMARGNTVYARRVDRSTEWRPVASFDDPELQNLSAYVVSPDGSKVVLTSTRMPVLHVALRDSMEAGSGLAAGVAMARALRASGELARWQVAEAGLRALAEARERAGAAADGELIRRLMGELGR